MVKWNLYKPGTLGEEEKRNKELIEKSEIVDENKEKNRRTMKAPDGHIFMTHIEWTPKPSLYGECLVCDGKATEEEIEEAKETILNRICECIRDVAKRKPDEFFIIHTPSKNPMKNILTGEINNMSSVGAKFALPTVLDDEEAMGRI